MLYKLILKLKLIKLISLSFNIPYSGTPNNTVKGRSFKKCGWWIFPKGGFDSSNGQFLFFQWAVNIWKCSPYISNSIYVILLVVHLLPFCCCVFFFKKKKFKTMVTITRQQALCMFFIKNAQRWTRKSWRRDSKK